MTRFRAVLFVTLLCLISPVVLALDDPTYDALRDARLDGRQVAVENLLLERDAHRFTLESGTVYFVTPVAERTIGAVFVGQGSYVLNPASEHERDHLAFRLGKRNDGFEVLRDRFESLILWFGDDTDRELMALGGPVTEGTPSAAATKALEDARRWQREDLEKNLSIRLLQDLLDVPGMTSGAFMALFDGQDELPPAMALLDPRGVEALSYPLMGGEDTALLVVDGTQGGFWYLSDRKGEVAAGKRAPFSTRARALRYSVDTTIDATNKVTGTTRIELLVRRPLRVLPMSLAPMLRIESARFRPVDGEWQDIPFIQENEEEDADVAVVLPRSVDKKEMFEIELSYVGEDILKDGGDENYYVGARTSWYPNVGFFADPANFELTYRIPEGRGLVSVGEQVESAVENGMSRTVWRPSHPIRVAGFNYGDFEMIERRDEATGITIQVYTNPGTPDVIREINNFIRSAQGTGLEGGVQALGDAPIPREVVDPELGSINTTKLAESAMIDGINAAQIGGAYFGPLPQRHVAITQQSDWSFGQSWPSLIYLPYMAFLTGSQRNQLGLGAGATEFLGSVGYHELAHQWWGHQIGWASYRDQWISEGFAEFHAALTAQHVTGWNSYTDFWGRARETIVAKARSPIPAYEVAPIIMGQRAATAKSPFAYQALTYSKGGFVVHMLRMAMWDPSASNPDAAFIAMMKDFTSTYAGKAPSTEDFKEVVERHMVPALNAAGDNTVDWFFDQWVYGMEVPKITANLEVDRAKRGTYRIQGKIAMAEVSDDFRVLVPVWVDFGRGEMARIALLPMIGPSERPIDVTLELPKKPKEVVINARHEVLARN
ncbi:MAG: M1 family aminopeptidase [Acidobacteriota bacterium]